MDRFWKVFAIVLASVVLVGLALATRYQYYTLGVIHQRTDRWTGQVQAWRCMVDNVDSSNFDFSKVDFSKVDFSKPPPKTCGWREYQP